MGRKKIEIKPLTDERNRNVTFLKRKAGLMKKAYELSVLCGVSVSLLIFSGNGKPYEFSSTDFDTEVDRYNEYEGTIERRRGVEFEAMARAGEDDDDDEDEDDIKPGAAKKAGPSKSLKGKESFKARRSVRYEERRRDKHPIEETFVGALVDETNDESPRSRERSDSAAGLQYALGMHANPPQNGGPSHQQTAPGGLPWNAYRGPNGGPFGFPFNSQGSSGAHYLPNSSINSHLGGNGNNGPGGSWDNSMLTTYAWLQIQQAHQEQKRHLLEKQQQQLLELTSRSGGAALFRDILGGNAPMNNNNAAAALDNFVWPTAPLEGSQVSTPPDEDLVWALGGGNGMPPAQQTQQQQQVPFGIDYPLTVDGKRRDPRDMFAAAAAAKRVRK